MSLVDYLLEETIHWSIFYSNKPESKHQTWVQSDLGEGNQSLDVFVVSFFSPYGRKVGRNRGKEGKRERIPPLFSSGIPEERKKGKYS
jgi:hypothetical protein